MGWGSMKVLNGLMKRRRSDSVSQFAVACDPSGRWSPSIRTKNPLLEIGEQALQLIASFLTHLEYNALTRLCHGSAAALASAALVTELALNRFTGQALVPVPVSSDWETVKAAYGRNNAISACASPRWKPGLFPHPAGYRESVPSVLLGDLWLLIGGFCASMPSIKLDAWGMRLCVHPLKWFPIDAVMDDDLRPMPRYGHSLTTFSRAEVLLFGGMTAGSYLADSSDVFQLSLVESEEAGDSLARDTVAGTSTGIVPDVAASVFSAPPVVIAPEAASFPEPIANHSSVPVTVRVPASLSVSPCSVSSVAVSTSMSSSTVTELSLPACPCSSPSVCTCIHRISTPTVTIACSGREFVSPEPRRARVHWRRVDLLGEPLVARGYHSATYSPAHHAVFVFGGISHATSISSLQMIHLNSSIVSTPVTCGESPSPRHGHTANLVGDKLWVFGGSNGGDVLRNGEELTDMFSLTMSTMVWARVSLNGFVPRGVSRCPCAVSVNTNIVTFGGALPLSGEVFVFDTVNESWRDGAVATTHCPHSTVLLKPFPRCCATAVAHQGSMFVYGGWHNGPLGSTLELDLAPMGPGRSDAVDIQVEATVGMRMWRTHGEFGEYFARLQRPILQTLGVIERDAADAFVGFDDDGVSVGEPSRFDSELDEELYSPLAGDEAGDGDSSVGDS